jgi:F0F1-type ATP synthase beta subunit
MLDPCIVGQEHYDVATAIQKILQDIIVILGMDELPYVFCLLVDVSTNLNPLVVSVEGIMKHPLGLKRVAVDWVL